MPKIISLPEDIIAKIKAGEVIERPVFAVKELVENAIDAGADRISISLEKSGLKQITIIDNGEGMTKEDLLICIKPHTTSKITSIDHLNRIDTLGFRGEALASIAAISHMTIKSKTADDTAGTRIEVENGELKHVGPIGMPVGTEVLVTNLFSSVPGRKNFLKSMRTEFRHIADWFSSVVLAHPDIHFIFSHNKKVLFDLPKTDSILDRLKLLLGATIYSSLLPIEYEDSYIKLSGFITKPHIATSTQKQLLFVNKRRVTDKVISQAVKEAYATLIEATAHPVCILFLQLPYELVDVNVHPRKEEIHFINTQLVFETIHKAVLVTLTANNLTQVSDIWNSDMTGKRLGNTDSYAGRLLKDEQLPWSLSLIPVIAPNQIMQLHNLYLLLPTKFGLLVVDQHAAHERILYEQFLESFKKHKQQMAVFQLPKPILLELSFSESETLKEFITMFEQFGFEIEPMRGTSFLIHSVPMLFQDRNIPQLIIELINELQLDKSINLLDKISQRMIAYLACRGAIKAGDKLTREQMKELVEKLEKTNRNATCPHGRPTKAEINLNNLHSMFKRK